jgi:hypothetical protein
LQGRAEAAIADRAIGEHVRHRREIQLTPIASVRGRGRYALDEPRVARPRDCAIGGKMVTPSERRDASLFLVDRDQQRPGVAGGAGVLQLVVSRAPGRVDAVLP